MAVQCQAIARSGSRCSSPVLAGRDYCWVHDPLSAPARRAASIKGGKARSNRARAAKRLPEAMTAVELHALLGDVLRQVITGALPTAVGVAAATLARAMLAAEEAGDLEVRLGEVESGLALARQG
jgi:hypothetical protein